MACLWMACHGTLTDENSSDFLGSVILVYGSARVVRFLFKIDELSRHVSCLESVSDGLIGKITLLPRRL